MKNTLRILLLEDDLDECNALHDAIDMHEDLILTKATNNMDIALNCVKEIMPEVIILDLELHKGYGSGLEFLNLLHDENLVLPSYILVTTNNISTITHELVRKLGADFIMLKSQDNYSAKYVIQFILTLNQCL